MVATVRCSCRNTRSTARPAAYVLTSLDHPCSAFRPGSVKETQVVRRRYPGLQSRRHACCNPVSIVQAAQCPAHISAEPGTGSVASKCNLLLGRRCRRCRRSLGFGSLCRSASCLRAFGSNFAIAFDRCVQLLASSSKLFGINRLAIIGSGKPC